MRNSNLRIGTIVEHKYGAIGKITYLSNGWAKMENFHGTFRIEQCWRYDVRSLDNKTNDQILSDLNKVKGIVNIQYLDNGIIKQKIGTKVKQRSKDKIALSVGWDGDRVLIPLSKIFYIRHKGIRFLNKKMIKENNIIFT